MPSLPSRYCLGIISQMLRMKRHCSPIASRDVLVGTFANIIVSRNRSRQRQRHRTTYKSPARLESHLYRCLRIYVIGSRTNKEWPPLRLQRDRGFVQSACRAHSDRQAHGLGKVSLRLVTSTFGVFNGADTGRLEVDLSPYVGQTSVICNIVGYNDTFLQPYLPTLEISQCEAEVYAGFDLYMHGVGRSRLSPHYLPQLMLIKKLRVTRLTAPAAV